MAGKPEVKLVVKEAGSDELGDQRYRCDLLPSVQAGHQGRQSCRNLSSLRADCTEPSTSE